MNSGLPRRIVEAITLILIALFAVSGFLGLRALIWRQEYQLNAMIQSGVLITAEVGGALGVAYVLLGAGLWRLLNLDGFSLQFGAVIGALIYGGYNAVSPLTIFSSMEPTVWRALQGGIDGLAIGGLLGGLVMVVSGRPLRLDRAGLSRYLILYVTLILLAWLVLWMETLVHLPDVVGIIVAVPLVIVLRLVVAWLDRRVDSSRMYG